MACSARGFVGSAPVTDGTVVYPAPGHDTDPTDRRRWYACWTRSRAEKRVKQWMDHQEIEVFLPLVEKERRWADRKKRVPFPLFPGYLFVRLPRWRIQEVVRTPSVVTVVGLNGRPCPIHDDEIESVRALVEGVNRTGILPSPADFLENGDWVRVVEGPFAGMEGILLEGARRPRVVVQLSAIRQAVRVELERSVLRPASRTRWSEDDDLEW